MSDVHPIEKAVAVFSKTRTKNLSQSINFCGTKILCWWWQNEKISERGIVAFYPIQQLFAGLGIGSPKCSSNPSWVRNNISKGNADTETTIKETLTRQTYGQLMVVGYSTSKQSEWERSWMLCCRSLQQQQAVMVLDLNGDGPAKQTKNGAVFDCFSVDSSEPTSDRQITSQRSAGVFHDDAFRVA